MLTIYELTLDKLLASLGGGISGGVGGNLLSKNIAAVTVVMCNIRYNVRLPWMGKLQFYQQKIRSTNVIATTQSMSIACE